MIYQKPNSATTVPQKNEINSYLRKLVQEEQTIQTYIDAIVTLSQSMKSIENDILTLANSLSLLENAAPNVSIEDFIALTEYQTYIEQLQETTDYKDLMK